MRMVRVFSPANHPLMAVKSKAKGASRKAASSSSKSANAKAPKFVYLFGKKKTDGDGSMRPLLGGKGSGLAEMCRIGLPVPPGFTITTEVCTYYRSEEHTSELQSPMY